MTAVVMKYPFEATFKEIQEETDIYISSVFSCLESDFRRADMKKMLLATRGKVFTLKTMHKLVECTRLKEFATKIHTSLDNNPCLNNNQNQRTEYLK